MHWGHNILYVEFLPQMFPLNLAIWKQSDKSKLNHILQNWPRLFKNINILKDTKMLRNDSRLKEIKDIDN